MLKKILLTLDGSENAEKALPWAKEFAGREKAQVILIRVVPHGKDRPSREREHDAAREYLLRMEKELNYSGIPSKTMVRRGDPAREIVDAAAGQGCDLIVIATRGGSTFKRWVIGGVTEQVMRMSNVPVLPVRSTLARPRQGHVHRLIVPLDGSKRAESGVWWCIRLAQLLRSKLIFLHVYPNGKETPRGWNPGSFEALNKRMNRICESLRKQGVPAEFKLQRGDAADRILNYADRNDLILTTTHGFGGVKRWLLGSVAEKLVHAGTVPVLVYKAPPDPKILRKEPRMNVEDICTRTVKSCVKESSLAEAANLMWDLDCGILPVVDDAGKVIGVVTDRDICMALALTGEPAADVPVRIVLHQTLYTCRPTDGVREALRVMRAGKVRRLPVVDGAGVLQGMLSLSDVARAAKPERLAGPTDVTDEDLALALKTISRRTPMPQKDIPVPETTTMM